VENSLKQRIVGAVVLIALAVIFLPSILKEKQQQRPFQSQIPAKPIELLEQVTSEGAAEQNKEVQAKLDQLEQQARLKDDLPEASIDELPQKQAELPLKAGEKDASGDPAAKTTINSSFEDAAWIIQAASFANLDNASALVTKLKKVGHKAFRREVTNGKGKLTHRIFVGPYIEKSRAAKALPQVNKLTASKGILLAYDPGNY